MAHRSLKYCAVFYEAQHNDSRTNIAISMSAAEHGAHIANYVEMINVIKNEKGKVVGVKAVDRMTNETFDIRANKVVLAGGPFTDSMRSMEQNDSTKPMQKAVNGASGTHIVLPGYYCPNNVRNALIVSVFLKVYTLTCSYYLYRWGCWITIQATVASCSFCLGRTIR
jgi:glycerol-3-phosphate dehydrogenase